MWQEAERNREGARRQIGAGSKDLLISGKRFRKRVKGRVMTSEYY
jgi:hypothetical protein